MCQLGKLKGYFALDLDQSKSFCETLPYTALNCTDCCSKLSRDRFLLRQSFLGSDRLKLNGN